LVFRSYPERLLKGTTLSSSYQDKWRSLPEKMMVAAVGVEREIEGERENAGSRDNRRATRGSGKGEQRRDEGGKDVHR
jgi:hypothetical protein